MRSPWWSTSACVRSAWVILWEPGCWLRSCPRLRADRRHPVGHYLVADLPRIGNRRLFLIPTSVAPTAADRRAIDALKRDGHVLVFLGAPGLHRESHVDTGGMFDLTGIRLALSNEPRRSRVTLDRATA